MIFIVGCNNKSGNTSEDTSTETDVYYIDSAETTVVKQEFEPTGTTREELVEEYMKALQTEPKDIKLTKTIPDNVTLKEFSFNNDDQLTLNFDGNYSQLKGIEEVLCRAAIVRTLSQVEGVEYIEFYVNGMPLVDSNEKPIGYMSKDSFIFNAKEETKYYNDAKLTLYFANADGDKLVESNIIVTYDGSISMEEVVIQQLINGPLEKDKGVKLPTIPTDTKLIKITTKEGICYVDFSDKFLDKLPNITDEVAIYSVVNSLVELPNVNKVQILINGEKKKTYRENIPIEDFLIRNLEIVEGE